MLDYEADDSEYVALMDSLERVQEDERFSAMVEAQAATIDWDVPFPDAHDERVAWARERAFFFRVTGSSLEDKGEPALRDVYLSLAKHGMFDGEFVMFGTCSSRLIMCKIARYFKIPIRPDVVFDSLYACCDDKIMLETFTELFAAGHFPGKPEHERLLADLGRRIDAKYQRTAGQAACRPPVVTTGGRQTASVPG